MERVTDILRLFSKATATSGKKEQHIMKRFNLKDFSDSDKFSKLSNSKTKFKINGLVVDKQENSNLFNIQRGTQILVDSGITVFENEDQTPNRAALSLLFALGCVPSDQGTNYSLIATQTDTEIVLNPNILDPGAYNRQKLNIKIDDKFPNMLDPIYELDESLPKMVANQIQEIKDLYTAPNVEQIASDFIIYSYSTSKPATKYFK